MGGQRDRDIEKGEAVVKAHPAEAVIYGCLKKKKKIIDMFNCF